MSKGLKEVLRDSIVVILCIAVVEKDKPTVIGNKPLYLSISLAKCRWGYILRNG